MNKNIILKYKKEFDTWVSGNQVLKGKKTKKGIDWRLVKDDESWENVDRLYVINDEYVKFRKALAENNIVQFVTLTHGEKQWRDILSSAYDLTEIDINDLRILDTSKLIKKGDWITFTTSSSITIQPIFIKTDEEANKFNQQDPELKTYNIWKPIKGELILAKHRGMWILSRFQSIDSYGYYLTDNINRCEKIAPFTGVIPEEEV